MTKPSEDPTPQPQAPENCPVCGRPVASIWKSASGLSDFIRYECGLEMHNKAMVKEWRVEWNCVIHRQEWGIVMSTLRRELDAVTARAERAEAQARDLHARDFGDVALASAREQRDQAYAELTAARALVAELQDAIICELPILFMLMPSVHSRLKAVITRRG